MKEQKLHAKFSASGSARWLSCPGSMALSEKAPPQRESAYAREGTEAHECLEYLLKNRDNITNAANAALKKYSKDKVEYGLQAVKWIHDRMRYNPGAELLCETKVDASPFTCEGQFGTLDAAIVEHFGKLTVIDYKFGAGIAVDPDENTQLIYYALGISNRYQHNFAEVELVIIQPRAYHESGETIRTWTCSMDELLKWEPKFKAGVELASDPFAPLKAGDWCKFCPAATFCPEIKNKAMAQAQIVFDDGVGVASVPAPTGIALPNLGVILDACDKLDVWIGKVREHALHVLERGERIEGFKLVEKRSTRKWIDEKLASKEARSKFGMEPFTEPELLSPAQFEKKLNGFPIDSFMEKHVTAKSSGVTIARDHDKRDAVIVNSPFYEIPDNYQPPRKEIMHMATKKKKDTKKKVAKKKTKK